MEAVSVLALTAPPPEPDRVIVEGPVPDILVSVAEFAIAAVNGSTVTVADVAPAAIVTRIAPSAQKISVEVEAVPVSL